jgi:hypothetical protein
MEWIMDNDIILQADLEFYTGWDDDKSIELSRKLRFSPKRGLDTLTEILDYTGFDGFVGDQPSPRGIYLNIKDGMTNEGAVR